MMFRLIFRLNVISLAMLATVLWVASVWVTNIFAPQIILKGLHGWVARHWGSGQKLFSITDGNWYVSRTAPEIAKQHCTILFKCISKLSTACLKLIIVHGISLLFSV